MNVCYWFNLETGRVMASDECPGELWDEISIEQYYAASHPKGRANNRIQRIGADAPTQTTPVILSSSVGEGADSNRANR